MEGIWPLVIIWVLFAIFGRKKKPAEPTAAPDPGRFAAAGPPDTMADKFAKALEELKRAEAEAQRSTQAGRAGQADAQARAYLAEQKRRAEAGRTRAPVPGPKPGPRPMVSAPKATGPARGVRRPVRPLDDDDADKSSETVPPEAVDYDTEAEQVAAARVRAAERRPVRRSEALGALSEAQLARRGDRPATAIGGKAEHEAWHEEVDGLPGPASVRPPARPANLLRWADGSLRGAVVLSELLGRPVAER